MNVLKKLVLFILGIIIFSPANAQDVLITKDGDALKVWGVEISSNAVFYREQQTEDSPIKRINKNDLLMVKLQSGEKIIIGEETKAVEKEPVATATPESASKIITINDLSPEAKAANDKIISNINAKDKIKILTDKGIGKKCDFVFARFLSTEKSVFTNEDIEVSVKEISFSYDSNKKPAKLVDNCNNYSKGIYRGPKGIIFNIKNKTDKPIYIDLGKSYFISNGGSETYYIPTSTTSSNSSSTGASVNLGAITGALGIGGIAGTLAGGVNVGGGNTTGTTNTVYSQRIVSIPPMGEISMPHKKIPNKTTKDTDGLNIHNHYLHGGEGEGNVKDLWLRIKTNSKNEFISGGLTNAVSYEDSPLIISNFISYSFEENCNITKSIKQEMYLGEIIGLPYKYYLPKYEKLQKEVSWPDNDIIVYPFKFEHNKSKGLKLKNM